jgi:hypothetical protein
MVAISASGAADQREPRDSGAAQIVERDAQDTSAATHLADIAGEAAPWRAVEGGQYDRRAFGLGDGIERLERPTDRDHHRGATRALLRDGLARSHLGPAQEFVLMQEPVPFRSFAPRIICSL